MTPIFMIKDAQSRFDGRHDEFSEYLRTEYGSPDGAWIMGDGARPKVPSKSGRFGRKLWRWFAERLRNAPAEGLEV
jgi:hypothetical protein